MIMRFYVETQKLQKKRIMKIEKGKNMKYKLTKTTKKYGSLTLYQIEAVKDFGNVEKGEKGGYVERENNLSQDGNAWVSGNARVYGDAWVYGNARVSGDAWVYGDAEVYDNAWVYGNAEVYDNAWVYGNARVSGDARVYGNAEVSDNARVYGDARVSDNAEVSDNARVYGDAWVYGNARVSDNAEVSDNARVYGDARFIGGYFYHTKQKSETIEKIELDDDYEILCKDPKIAEKEKEDTDGAKISEKTIRRSKQIV